MATLYWNNAAGDELGNNLASWWQDEACTVQALALPSDGDAVVFLAGRLNGIDVFHPASCVFKGTSIASSLTLPYFGCDIVFQENASCTGTCGAIPRSLFYGSSSNQNEYLVYAEFHDTSENTDNCITAKFYDTAKNTADAAVTDAYFYDQSFNEAAPGLTRARFYDDSVNYGALNGGTVDALYIEATYGASGWTLARSPAAIGGTITSVVITNIGVVPSAADVRAGTAVGVSPAVGTLVVPAAVTSGQPILLAAEDAMVKYLTACALGATIVSSVNGETDDLEPPLIGVTAEDAAESRASPVGNRYLDITVEVITPLEAVIQGGDPLTPAARRSLIVGVDQSLRNDNLAELLTTSGVFSVDGVTFLGERQQVSGRRHGYAFAYRLACRLS